MDFIDRGVPGAAPSARPRIHRRGASRPGAASRTTHAHSAASAVEPGDTHSAAAAKGRQAADANESSQGQSAWVEEARAENCQVEETRAENSRVEDSCACASSGMLPTDLLGQITLLERLAARIASHAPDDGPAALAAEASRRTVAVLDQLGAQRLAWLGRIEADGLWRADTVRSFPYWIAWHDHRSLAIARREASAAARLRDHLPATLRSARAGRLTAPQVEVLSRTLPTSDERCAALAQAYPQQTLPAERPVDGATHDSVPSDREARAENGTVPGVGADGRVSWADPSHDPSCPADRGWCTCERAEITGEQAMLGVAARFGLRDLGKAARRFAQVADPEADERGYRHAQDREHLDLSRTLGGYHVSGFLTEEHGQMLTTALDAAIGVPSKDDGLRPTQRRAIALAGVVRSYLERGEAGGAGAGVRPHLTVLVPWRDFVGLAGYGATEPGVDERSAEDVVAELLSPGPTWLDGSGPVPRQVLETIAADCAVTRVVFGPDSEVLDVGRSQRTFTSARRKAVVARDQGCVWPSCSAPVQISEIHHARRHWVDGGATSTDNAALLCWFHHRHVDRERIAMAWRGGWVFSDPGGYDRPWDPGFPEIDDGEPSPDG